MAIHTLGAAAQEILRDLGRPHGVKSTLKDSDLVRPERVGEVVAVLNEAQNFFKHGARDANKSFRFFYEATQFYLLDAAILYIQVAGRQFPEVTAFIAWSFIKFPDILAEDAPIRKQLSFPKVNPDNFEAILQAIDAFNGSA